jgi:hypothetical protein
VPYERPIVKTWIAFAVFLFCNLVVIVLPWLPYVGEVFDRWTVTEAAVVVIGVHASLLMAFLGIAYGSVNGHLKDMNGHISKALQERPEITALLASRFYEDFATACSRATSRICVSYFAPYPPTHIPDDDKAKYYRAHVDTVRKKTNIRYRRLVRRTPENRNWVCTLMKELAGCAHVDIGLLEERQGDMPLAMSTQIIDHDQVWLVALETHEHSGHARDVYVRDKVFADMLSKYFDRLWHRSKQVMVNGNVTNDGQQLLSDEASDNAAQ